MLDKKYYIVKNKNDKAITYFEYDKIVWIMNKVIACI